MIRNDLRLYDLHAADWWNPDSAFSGTLHRINTWRLSEIERRLGADLRGVAAVDLGCGGGLLSEALARRGAHVTGIDQSPASIAAAQAHGADLPLLHYLHGDALAPPLPAGQADVVTATDLLEHLDAWPQAIQAAATLLRPGGHFFVTTINRTRRSRWLAVAVAEGFGLIPAGTHDPQRFITPRELKDAAESCGLMQDELIGQRLLWWSTLRSWRISVARGASTALGYGAWFRKSA